MSNEYNLIRPLRFRYIIVINIPRKELSLRPDVCWLLQDVGIDSRNLVFVDEIDIEKVARIEHIVTGIILTDHNR